MVHCAIICLFLTQAVAQKWVKHAYCRQLQRMQLLLKSFLYWRGYGKQKKRGCIFHLLFSYIQLADKSSLTIWILWSVLGVLWPSKNTLKTHTMLLNFWLQTKMSHIFQMRYVKQLQNCGPSKFAVKKIGKTNRCIPAFKSLQ